MCLPRPPVLGNMNMTENLRITRLQNTPMVFPYQQDPVRLLFLSSVELTESAADSNPGPNQYRVQHDPTQHSPPSFTMGARFTDHTPQSTGPGPSNYHPKQRPSSAVSITPRRSREKKSCVPGANHYHVPPSLTRRGISSGHMTSLKGRRSIVCYSGFPSSHLSRLASLAL
ncbi:hypothetical protein GBAR_LOCUS17020 [Geodia barretti]|uniref:Uncharacterized protein n=1 Tax=Geodia barretti TaxID=519541 RepID=A0AA35WXA2_GEOBA|nr:hypothetical protein GBAR_LOCUS17020 [Geodia barretti]